MLLFIRNPYYSMIRAGVKRFELRAGTRYRNVKVGDRLSLNGRERAVVTSVETFERAEEASRASSRAGYYLSVAAIRACYPWPEPTKLYMIHFRLEPSAENRTNQRQTGSVDRPAA